MTLERPGMPGIAVTKHMQMRELEVNDCLSWRLPFTSLRCARRGAVACLLFATATAASPAVMVRVIARC